MSREALQPRNEHAELGWIRRFVAFNDKRHQSAMSASEIAPTAPTFSPDSAHRAESGRDKVAPRPRRARSPDEPVAARDKLADCQTRAEFRAPNLRRIVTARRRNPRA